MLDAFNILSIILMKRKVSCCFIFILAYMMFASEMMRSVLTLAKDS